MRIPPEIEETSWTEYPTDRHCPECHGSVVAMVNPNREVDFFMCEECNFSYGGDVHGVKQ